MGIFSRIWLAQPGRPPTPPDPYCTPFKRSYDPFPAPRKLYTEYADGTERDNYPHRYGDEFFRSAVEAEWAKAFDRKHLPWQYEPLRFDMGPRHHSYTPDFLVSAIRAPNASGRPLYIEVKWLGERMDLTKYVRFTEWYDCALLVLAHFEYELWRRSKQWIRKPRPDPFRPAVHHKLLILNCRLCGTYMAFQHDVSKLDGYLPDDLEDQRRIGGCTCRDPDLSRTILPDDFLISRGQLLAVSMEDLSFH